MQAYFINIKIILKDKQKSLLKNLFNNDFKIWYLKNIIIYNILISRLKPKIHLNIKLYTNNNKKYSRIINIIIIIIYFILLKSCWSCSSSTNIYLMRKVL